MSKKQNNEAGIVYSTEHGRMCPKCGKPKSKCTCKKEKPNPKKDGIVRLQLDKKGRKGKAVTLVTGVPLDPDSLAKLTKQLKQKCGAGGTLKAGVIEIQGDHREMLMQELQNLGYTVKRSGG